MTKPFNTRISIHALTRRATLEFGYEKAPLENFNPRPHEEGDKVKKIDGSEKLNFNPRPHEEGDLFGCAQGNADGYFNPRPHEEGDVSPDIIGRMLLYFNPRPHEEGDADEGFRMHHAGNFNPRPHEEGDHAACQLELIEDISIHALTRRATSDLERRAAGAFDFNPRPHEEGDNRAHIRFQFYFYFNPRPHEEGDVADLFPKNTLDISIHALTRRATFFLNLT